MQAKPAPNEDEGSSKVPSVADGAGETASELLREGGVGALFKGVAPGAVQSGLEKAIYFYAYVFLKSFYVARIGPSNTVASLFLGYIADWAHLPVTLPLDRVAKTMQTTKDDFSDSIVSTDPLSVARLIWDEQGVSGFYRGLGSFVVCCLRPAIQYTVFDRLKVILLAARARKSSGNGNTKQLPAPLGAIDAFFLVRMLVLLFSFV